MSEHKERTADPNLRGSHRAQGSDLRDAPGYEAGQRATARGAGLQNKQIEDERLDADLNASALDVEPATEDNDVESDGFYSSDVSTGSDAPDPGHHPAAAKSSSGEAAKIAGGR